MSESLKQDSTDLSPSLGSFADLVAEGTPSPGGGSVSAYSGVLAASLGQMVCNLTIGKKKYEQAEPRVIEIRGELERLSSRLRQLITEDAASFDQVLAAYRLPKETDEQKAERARSIEDAGRGAAQTPFETAERSVEVLKLLSELSRIGNQNALSDVKVGAQLALTAVKGAHYNVAVNLGMLPEPEAADLQRHITELVGEAKRMAEEIEG
ncbi:MAG TPA: cyclodeaminase/cyclohydrolase family protein [Blastocatellia bacterium]|nr:cyclodeaminase/cyclohydrolase family protein [Blastocatellia bacterium]